MGWYRLYSFSTYYLLIVNSCVFPCGLLSNGKYHREESKHLAWIFLWGVFRFDAFGMDWNRVRIQSFHFFCWLDPFGMESCTKGVLIPPHPLRMSYLPHPLGFKIYSTFYTNPNLLNREERREKHQLVDDDHHFRSVYRRWSHIYSSPGTFVSSPTTGQERWIIWYLITEMRWDWILHCFFRLMSEVCNWFDFFFVDVMQVIPGIEMPFFKKKLCLVVVLMSGIIYRAVVLDFKFLTWC